MVVILVMVIGVDHFMLVLLNLLLLSGVLVLLYHYTHYPSHGGSSSTGASCGVFIVGANAAAGLTYWACGAALSFMLHIILFVVVILAMVPVVVDSLLMPVAVLVIPTGALALLCYKK